MISGLDRAGNNAQINKRMGKKQGLSLVEVERNP